MIARFFGRQVASLAVALGVFLGGIAPTLAMPSGGSMPGMAMMMPNMAMDNSCMEMGKAAPNKQTPSKSSDCAVCISCATNIALVLDLVPVPSLYKNSDRLIGPDVNPDGIASLPALPPPIFRA
jgi:hypothetical protein